MVKEKFTTLIFSTILLLFLGLFSMFFENIAFDLKWGIIIIIIVLFNVLDYFFRKY